MRMKILIAAFAGLSLLAAAQTQSNEKNNTKATETKTARETGTGQATGRTAVQLHSQGLVHRDLAARETGSGMATGKTAVADVDGDGHADRTAGSGYNVKNQTKARVAAGDVNGDGTADATVSGANGTKKDAHSTVKSPREASSGMATGKRQ